MSKMFVHYSGTVEAFKSIASQYNNKIVFIKGGENGEGAAIYTHGEYYGNVKDALAALQTELNGLKYFTSIKSGDKVATAAGKDGIITFNATDPALVSVDVDSKGVNIGLSKTFTDAVSNNTSNITEETNRATEAEEKLRTDLGTKSSTEGDAFTRIKALEEIINTLLGGNGNSISSQITAAIEGLDSEKEGITEHISVKVVEVDGKLDNVTVSERDIASAALLGAVTDGAEAETAFGKAAAAMAAANAAKTAGETAASNALEDAKDYADSLIAVGSAFELRVAANENAISTLNGTDSVEGSVAKAVKDGINDFATKMSDNQTIDTFKELIDYAASHTSEYSTLAGQVLANTNAIGTLNGAGAGSIAKIVNDAVAAEAEIARAAEKANADDIDAAEGRIKAIEDDYLKTADKTELTNAINGKVAQSAYDTKMQELAKADTDNLAAAKKYADDAIAALDVTDAAVENQFVTAVSETDGKISVSRSVINASQIGITNTESDAFAASTTNVLDALTELASFWAWEEL